jgi:NitT/TauT family transport system substrate-binding protein
MGYIPTVLYAPFYMATRRGYFADAGLDVHFDYGFERDGLEQVSKNEIAFAIAKSNQVLLARAQDWPVVLVWNWYWRDFTAIIALQESGIVTPQDLIGRTVGIPGRGGSDYFVYHAILHAAGVDPAMIREEMIGWTQVEALAEKRVDAVVGALIREGVLLRRKGYALNVMPVADFLDIVGAGIVTSQRMIAEEPAVIRGFVKSLVRGQAETIADPDAAFRIALEYVPGLDGEKAETERVILNSMVEFCGQAEQQGISDLHGWQSVERFMREAGMLSSPLDVSQAFTNEFIE